MYRSTISKSSYKICVLCQKGGTYFSKAKKNMCRKTKLMERDQKLDPYYQTHLHGEFTSILKTISISMKNQVH